MDASPSRRPSFSAILHEVLGSDNVYFQPPPDKKMEFPAIVYELEDYHVQSADNGPYSVHDRYQVTLLDYDPDNPVKRKLLGLPHSSYSRHFATSGLNHDVFVIHH